MKKAVDIYTDGACSGNPGPGGWAAILIFGKHFKKISGAEPSTTNNRMELLAVIEGVSALREPCDVRIFSDSSYVVNAFVNGWLTRWAANGWHTAAKQPVKNVDLWQRLVEILAGHTYQFVKVAGHSDNALNNQCDEMARQAIEQLRQDDPTVT